MKMGKRPLGRARTAGNQVLLQKLRECSLQTADEGLQSARVQTHG